MTAVVNNNFHNMVVVLKISDLPVQLFSIEFTDTKIIYLLIYLLKHART